MKKTPLETLFAYKDVHLTGLNVIRVHRFDTSVNRAHDRFKSGHFDEIAGIGQAKALC
jgi:hypothetical protein